MSTCCWCTPGGSAAIQNLKSYASATSEFDSANDDLCYCLECVDEYHKARDEVPSLHEALWELETRRLVAHFDTALKESGEDDDLYIVEGEGKIPLSCYTGPGFEKHLRVPVLEILKYPYLLLHQRLSELFVEALCRMEQSSYSYQVVGKHPGIYLLMVHPNETIRRWAILTARNLGKVDRDDYYDIQEVLTCLFKVIELGLFENPDIYSSSVFEKGKLILLPPHLYDTTNYKNYWLGICMLLTVLEEQAMDSLLLGPGKQNDFMQSIMNTMKKQTDDDQQDPFWPALHCFMVILDKLGSKVWGQLIDPIQAFQTIINNESYQKEIQAIRQNCRRTKVEPPSDYGDEMITCSQIVYNCHLERPNKDNGRKSAVCPDYCPSLYEDMQTLTDMFQYDIGRDMQLHNSTFLWYIPFVHSLMDLKDLGVAYSVVVIHHLCSEIKDVLHEAVQSCDKVSEFFVWILVTVVELNLKKHCLNSLWVSSEKWVEAVVKCARLPATVFACGAERGAARNSSRNTAGVASRESESVPWACMNLIRNILKEGYQVGQNRTRFLDQLNVLRRTGKDWKLSPQQAQELQACLKHIVRSLQNKAASSASPVESAVACVPPPASAIKQERTDDRYLISSHGRLPSCLLPKKTEDGCPEASPPGRRCSLNIEDPLLGTSADSLARVKQEPEEVQKIGCSRLAKGSTEGQRSGIVRQGSRDSTRSFPRLEAKEASGQEKALETSIRPSENSQSARQGSRNSEIKGALGKLKDSMKSKTCDLTLKLKQLVENRKRENSSLPTVKDRSVDPEKQVDSLGAGPGNPRGTRTETFPRKPLSLKRGSADSLSEFKNVQKADQCSDEDSTDDEMAHVPFSQIRQALVKKTSAARASTSGTDSELDRDLDALSCAACAKAVTFPVDSRQEDSCPCHHQPLKRKVQGAVKSLSDRETPSKPVSDPNKPRKPVIIISDTSSDEDENKANLGGSSKEEGRAPPLERQPSAQGPASAATASHSPLRCEDFESQCFEFETEEDIYSVWQDSQPEEKAKTCSPTLSDLEIAQQINNWGYDTDYIAEDVTENDAEAVEQQVNEGESGPEVQLTADKSCLGPRDDAVRSPCLAQKQADDGDHSGLAIPVVPGTSASVASSELPSDLRKPKTSMVKATHKSPMRRNGRPAIHREKSLPTKTARSAPAVVPPRKVHRFPEPTSVTEKLSLKKKVRRAAELSQRTQDSITRLREHGKAAGELPQRRRAKLIQAPRLVGRNKKLWSCQEHYFFSQKRHKEREKSRGEARAPNMAKKPVWSPCLSPAGTTVAADQEEAACLPGPSSSGKRGPAKQSSVGKVRAQPTSDPSAKESPLARQGPVDSVQENASGAPGSSSVPVSGGSGTGPGASLGSSASLFPENAGVKEGPSKFSEKSTDEEDDNLFLTQRDPVDMELCSQADGDPDPTHTDINLPHIPFQNGCSATETPKEAGGGEKVSRAGANGREPPAPNPSAHVFAKPFPLAKPSTAKIFSPTSSRSANLTKEMENLPKPLPAPKSRLNPPRPLPPSESARPRHGTLNGHLQPQHLHTSAPRSHGAYDGRTLASARGVSRPEAQAFSAQSSGMNAQHRDHSIFLKEVLKWSYDMFANARQLGPPDHLQRKIVGSVPVRFQDCNEYFNTFFPLTMLNAFEEVAQEWLANQKSKEQKPFRLNLLSYNAGVSKADFTVNVLKSDLDKQLHPKEDDLVFLKVSEQQSYSEDGEAGDSLVCHVGLVTQFSPPSIHDSKSKEQHVLCHLSIQTQGNLSRVSKQVRCVVVSSLVTTQRRFRALLLLNRSPLARAILRPSYLDFCPRDLNVDSEKSSSYTKDLNEDQRRAVDMAHAVVTQHPAVPKICLIHGPPGTGKSKTIVGLLYRMLSEPSGKNTVQRLNAKIKRNRVLVCAPSNTAVDDLMKKIIIEFKEKCRDKKNALGNCGDINLVRLGREKNIDKEVRRFSLDDQIKHRINRATLGKDQDLQKRKEDLDRQLDLLSRQRAMDRNEKREKRQRLDEEIGRLVKERQCLASELKQARGRSQELRASIILESHIICCTLSTSGGLLLESAFRRLGGDPVSCVIVDEAGQTCEVETLIPLIHGCKKLVLVGDPKQLPPIVKSVKAQDYGYDQSLMGRLCRDLKSQVQENRIGRLPVLQLKTQYRMHPDIWLFPAKYIYEAAVTTDEKTQENRCSLEWPFQPYMLFDVLDGKEERESDSYTNPQEVKLVIELIKLIKGTRSGIGLRNIGIITPYSAQKRRIRSQLEKEFGENSACEVDTVDGFQGREKDCIIVTCVRANSTQGSIGFLRSLPRLNVTITRAKYSLFIVGKLKTLMENKDWNHLIQDAQKRGSIFPTSSCNYKAVAQKILKLKREGIGQAGAPRSSKLGEGSRRDPPHHPTAHAGALLCERRPLPGPPELASPSSASSSSSKSYPLPAQPKPAQERPKDPRLARRATSAVTAGACKEGSLSGPGSSSGAASPPGHDGPAIQRSQSNPLPQAPSGSPVPAAHPQAPAVPARFPGAQDRDWRFPAAADLTKTFAQGDDPQPTKQSKECDYRRRTMEELQENPGLIEAKRRRTSH